MNTKFITDAIEQYSDMLMRICVTYMKNEDEAQDIIQNVFLKLMLSDKDFESEEHLKAWLIRVTVNQCKDLLKSFFRKNTIEIEENFDQLMNASNEKTDYEWVREEIWKLPEKYRIVIYLYYYEEYSTKEIAQILSMNENTVSTRLKRGKDSLKLSLSRGTSNE